MSIALLDITERTKHPSTAGANRTRLLPWMKKTLGILQLLRTDSSDGPLPEPAGHIEDGPFVQTPADGAGNRPRRSVLDGGQSLTAIIA